jgi:hypothetical protein
MLALAVAAIHVKDQGGLPGTKAPDYLQASFYALEAAAVVAVSLLAMSHTRALGWLLALGVGAGPILGYLLTRGPGLPNATEDKGNWGEPLGVVSLVVEGALVLLAVAVVTSARRRLEVDSDDAYGRHEGAARTHARSSARR